MAAKILRFRRITKKAGPLKNAPLIFRTGAVLLKRIDRPNKV